jgi:Zn-dependent peptidase ImmA (M78 family)
MNVEEILNEVFGSGTGTSPTERARTSTRRFVRGLDLLTFEKSSKATGRRLSAVEALDAYGFDKLCEIVHEGSAVITADPKAVGRTLSGRRKQLGVEIRTLASKSGLAPEVIDAMEASKRRPIQDYERVARLLGLDERLLSFQRSARGNERVAVRLRHLFDDRPAMSSSVVTNLAEASWVAMTQIRLEEKLGLHSPKYHFTQSEDFGSYYRPAYSVGYELANKVRQKIGIGVDPIPSMRELVERHLAIPVVQAPLGDRIAGATVQSDSGRRAIVLNVNGKNTDASVRRSTIAHELCHLLFDPSPQLQDLRVDEYGELDQREDTRTDPVEQRANAFAVQLLAPQSEVVVQYSKKNDLQAVLDYFGISFTAGRYQVWNALKRAVSLDSIRAPNRTSDSGWEAMETYTLAYHPIRSLMDHPSRAGRFGALAVRAAEVGVISWDTVGEWLYCSEADAKASREGLRDFFGDVFA